jgi:hypothetical protein
MYASLNLSTEALFHDLNHYYKRNEIQVWICDSVMKGIFVRGLTCGHISACEHFKKCSPESQPSLVPRPFRNGFEESVDTLRRQRAAKHEATPSRFPVGCRLR